MGAPATAEPAMLFAALFSSDKVLLEKGVSALCEDTGSPVCSSEIFEFSETDYYREEMGKPLFKQLFLFPGIFDPGRISETKLLANRLEQSFSVHGKRKVNIDPGYITLTKVVLATTKNYSHRIYVGKGIYAEITLSWEKGAFNPNPWTYPDYKRPAVIDFFNTAREKVKKVQDSKSEVQG